MCHDPPSLDSVHSVISTRAAGATRLTRAVLATRVSRMFAGVAMALSCALVSACGGGGDSTDPRGGSHAVSTVEVSSPRAVVGVGGSVVLQVTVRDAAGRAITDVPIAWSSSDPSIASVSQTGVVTAIRTGTVQIAATAEGRSAVTSVTVSARGVGRVDIASAAPELTVGSSTALTVRLYDENGEAISDRPVTWTSSAPTIASVSETGTVVGLAPGVATITATSEGKSATIGVSVRLVPVASVAVTPVTDTVVIGQTTQLAAVTRDGDGNALSQRVVTWSSSDVAVATVSSSGVVTGIAAGAATITATSEGRSASARIAVRIRPVSSVIVSPAQSALAIGGTVQLTVQLTDGTGTPITGRPVTFVSSNPAVATVSGTGMVTGVATGSATITATTEGRSGTASVSVSLVPVASVRITPGEAELLLSRTVRLSATALDASGAPLANRTVTWSSAAPNIVTVDADGTVRGVGVGIAAILATIDGRTAAAPVTVRATPVASVTVSPAAQVLILNDVVDFFAVPRDASGGELTGRTTVWASSDDRIAVVSSTGRVRALAVGLVDITATVDGVVGSSRVNVIVEPVVSVRVDPPALTLVLGTTAQLTATPMGRAGPLQRPVTFTTSAPGIATVSSTGLVTAVALGSATITATSEGRSTAVTVSVIPVPVATVAVSIAPTSITAGATAQASATLRDAANNVLAGRSVVWSTSNASVATVDAAGVVTGVGPGSANITATSEGKSGTAVITVTPRPVASVTVSIDKPSVTVGTSATATATLLDANGNALTGRTIAWTSSNTNVATISSTGVITTLSAGTTVITATSEGKSGSATLTVTTPAVATVTVTLGASSIAVGATTTATAVLRDAANNPLSGRAVAWASSVPGVATVNASGVVTAVSAGTTVISATSEGKTGSATLTVTVAPVATVSVTLGTSSLAVGSTTQAAAVTRDASNNTLTGRIVTWSSSNTAVATVNGAGLVTAVAAGSANIIATSEGKSGSAALTVTSPPITSVTVALDSTPISVGSTVKATATARDGTGTVVTGRPVTWASSNTGVATISSSGVITAVGAGTTTVTATSDGVSGTVTLTVTVPPVATVTVTVGSSTLAVNGTTQASAETRAANGTVLTGRSITWSSSNTAVLTVSTTGVVTARGTGTANVIATSEGKSGSASITVSSTAPSSIVVTVAQTNIEDDGTTLATAVVRTVNGVVIPDAVVTWTSSNPLRATVSSTGVVRGVSAGAVTITGSIGSLSSSQQVQVSTAAVATVTLQPTSATLSLNGPRTGRQVQLSVVLKSANGTTLTGRDVTWVSDRPLIATVGSDGLVNAVAEGIAVVRALSEGKSALANITVAK